MVLTSPSPLTTQSSFFKLPGPLTPAAAKIMKLSNAYVAFNDAQKVTGINWGGFKDAVVAHPGTDLAFDKLQSTSITNQTASVDNMASKIAQFLVDTFALKMNADGLPAQISAAFNSLDKKESSGWFSSYTNEGHGSSWEYRIVFALPNPDRTWSCRRSSADGGHLEVRGWFGLTGESRHIFTANITAMELVVNKS